MEDDVAFGVEGNNEVLVAGACSGRVAARVVGEELTEQFCDNKDLVGRHFNKRWQNR